MQERAATDDDEAAAAAADMNERGEEREETKKIWGGSRSTTGGRASGGRKERGTDGELEDGYAGSSAVGDPLYSFLPLSDKNQRRAMIRKSALQRKMGGRLKASFPSPLSQHPPVSSEEHMKSNIKLFCML